MIDGVQNKHHDHYGKNELQMSANEEKNETRKMLGQCFALKPSHGKINH